MKWNKILFSFFLSLSSLLLCFPVNARITKIVITKTESYQNGKMYGNIGEYERIYGQAYGEVDPDNPLNRIIQDIGLASRNARGMVEYSSEFILLRPRDMNRSNDLLFLSLPNRGNAFGVDTILLNRGYVILWGAWQGDVLPGENRLTMSVPTAIDHGKKITGSLRTEYQVTNFAKTLNLSSGYYSGSIHHSYETISLDNSDLILTKRVHELDLRIKISNSEWAFSDCRTLSFPGTPSNTKISLRNGFDPNYIYELVYTAKDPLVLGLGFAAIRDMASFFRHEVTDEVGSKNPILGEGINGLSIRAAIMQGISQCGNFTRSFLQLGFNQDEDGRIVFEGINTHIATRRISLNVRFGRPGGGGLQREDHLFPSNEPPFTWDSRYEPISGITGGILEACMKNNTCPKIIQTLSSSEYWQLRASLRTTDSKGIKDLKIPSNVRIYHFAGTQHIPSANISSMSGRMENSNSYWLIHRALMIALENWVLNGELPPASSYPTLATHTLVKPDKKSTGWPDIPGVVYNGRINEGSLINYGSQYNIEKTSGILSDPPKETKDKQYEALVPKVNKDGNEIAGIRSIELQVPLGTYTGWSLRRQGYGEGDLAALSGMFIPFEKNRAARIAVGDPRVSLSERYGSYQAYLREVVKAAKKLVKEGFLLPQDVKSEIEKAEKRYMAVTNKN
jgi:hypothetical protein